MKDKSVEVGLPVILHISLVAGGPYFPDIVTFSVIALLVSRR